MAAGAIRSNPVGYYLFSVGGADPASESKAEGAETKVEKISHKLGSEKQNQIMIGNVSYTDLKLDLGMSLGAGMKEWIDATLKQNTDYLRQDCALTYADYNRKSISMVNCSGCLIKKVTFPALDAKGKDALKISVEIGVEKSEHVAGDGKAIQGKTDPQQKSMANYNFTCTIPGWPERCVTKVDAVSVEQKITQHYIGRERGGYIEPVDIGDIDITIHFAPSKDEETAIKKIAHQIHTLGDYDHSKDIDIRVAWLGHKGSDELGALNFLGCIPHEITREGVEAGKEGLVTYKVKFGVTYIDLSEVKLSQ